MKQMIIFDMDGVLIDVSNSFRQTIIETVRFFTDITISNERIQEMKNNGGFNDDWQLSFTLIQQYRSDLSFSSVVNTFEELYFGKNGDGFCKNEIWYPRNDVFDLLVRRYQFAIFTGRTAKEADLALVNLANRYLFEPIITMESVSKHKPDPEGLRLIQNYCRGSESIYVGDNIDDARAAKAAGIPFVGVVSLSLPHRDQLIDLFQSENARDVICDVNELEKVLP